MILQGTHSKDEQHVMNKTGQVVINQAVQLNRWKEYFKELLNRPSPDELPDLPPAETPRRINTDRPSKQEIRKAILPVEERESTGPRWDSTRSNKG